MVYREAYNEFYHKVVPLYYKHASVLIFDDKVKNDSMHQFVYLRVKENVLKVYDSIFSNSPHATMKWLCLF